MSAMKYFLRAALALTAAAALGLACSKKNKVEQARAFPDSLVADEVLAVVNGDTILGRDLQVLAYISMTATDSLKNRSFNTMLLDQLIDRAVFVREAKAAGLAAPDSVVDQLMGQFTAHFTTDLASELGKRGLMPVDFRKAIERDLMIRAYVREKIEPSIAISEADSRAYFDQHANEYVGLDSVRARHIILQSVESDTPEEKAKSEKLINEIRTRVQKGEKFERLAKMYSQDNTAERGGDLGYFARGTMVKEFEDVAFSLKKGEMSKVFQTQFGYHIVMCVDKKQAAPPNYDLAKPKIEALLRQQALGTELQNRLKRNRDAAIIVRNYEEKTGA
jgi:parvulin-like peptidyl-prolyl isomerase